jgi:hypothetical protein
MDRTELLRRLRSRRAQLSEDLSQQIYHIIEVDASIQAIEGRDIHVPTFPPQNPFRDVPSRRIDHDTYLLIARNRHQNRLEYQGRKDPHYSGNWNKDVERFPESYPHWIDK